MRRYPSPLTLSAAGLSLALVAMAGLVWFSEGQGWNVSEALFAILTPAYVDELLPRLVIAVFFGLGGYLLTRSGPQPNLPRVSAACAITGVLACLYMMIRIELSFAQAYPEGSISAGWAPGAARAALLPIPYAAALVQAIIGLAASTVLLMAMAVKRSHA